MLFNVNATLNPQVKSSVIEVSQLVNIKSAVHSVSVPEKKIRFLYVQKVCPLMADAKSHQYQRRLASKQDTFDAN